MSADKSNTTSTGHALSETTWLDAHFEACRPEYEDIIRSAGFEPGWRVLDAGCGSGAFLPLLAELVGSNGSLAAVDLAPENVAAVEEQLSGWDLPCAIETRVASLSQLPYPDASFDGVWCANVTQYLTDAALDVALAEMRRVVRPGGLVAIKDVDATVMRLTTRAPRLLRHLQDASYTDVAPGTWRGPMLPSFLVRAGFTDVAAQTTLVERYAPLRPVERQFLAAGFSAFASMSMSRGVPHGDIAEWAWLREHADEWVSEPDHYYREGNVLAVGRVPVS